MGQQRGDVLSPRIVPSRNSLGITGGHCDVTGFAPGILELGPKDGVADGPWEVVEAVRYQIKHGAQVIKTCATAGVLSLEGPVGAQQYSYDELKAMVDEAARHGIKVAAHAHGTEGIKAAVRAGVISIEHGSLLDDEAMQLMKDRGTYLVPTSYLAERINMDVLPPLVKRKAQTIIPLARESLRKAIAAGVKIAFGTDAAVYPHGENARNSRSTCAWAWRRWRRSARRRPWPPTSWARTIAGRSPPAASPTWSPCQAIRWRTSPRPSGCSG